MKTTNKLGGTQNELFFVVNILFFCRRALPVCCWMYFPLVFKAKAANGFAKGLLLLVGAPSTV